MVSSLSLVFQNKSIVTVSSVAKIDKEKGKLQSCNYNPLKICSVMLFLKKYKRRRTWLLKKQNMTLTRGTGLKSIRNLKNELAASEETK